MRIRKATTRDLGRVMELYDVARAHMRASGNDVQWVGGYPSQDLAERDLAAGALLVCEDEGEVCAVMSFLPGPDPTYKTIEGGAWLRDRPYWVVHRIAVGVTGKGVGSSCLSWAREQAEQRGCDLRCDTHETNVAMRRALAKAGLVECGTIRIADGTPRLAFQSA